MPAISNGIIRIGFMIRFALHRVPAYQFETQTPPAHTPLWQSASVMQPWPSPQAAQEPPPQSTPVSVPFCMPSEHEATGAQTLGEPLQEKPDSIMHVEVHPSPSATFPSSQASPGASMPSPQIATQVLGDPVQKKPVSTVQTAVHPSPLVTLPSSHVSPGSTKPFPHTPLHTPPAQMVLAQSLSTKQPWPI